MPNDFYDILGVSRDADQSEIKKAYRKMSKEWHPDKHKGEKEAEQKFKEINEAYEVLSDPKKKQMYDQFGSAEGFQGGQGGFGGFDPNNFQQGDFGGFGDIFESFFGGGGRTSGQRRPDTRGQDIEVALDINFTEAVSGVKKTIALDKHAECSTCSGSGMESGSSMQTCATCSGTGQVVKTAQSFFGTIQQAVVCSDCQGNGQKPEKPCKDCSGTGRRQERKEVDIDVPAGIHDGQTLRLQTEGHAGSRGGQAGDLFVHIRVRPDSRFTRDNDDIRTAINIATIDAILGTDVSIETVHGPVTLSIPAGTQPEQIMRIKGKGMPILSTSRFGDHYVTVHIEIPKKLSKKEKQLMEEWRKL